MDNHVNQLVKIAGSLDKAGGDKFASRLDAISDKLLGVKVAQYVGLQGYWIRNTRCWSNCYRQKRAGNPDMPAQEVWGKCHEEYLASINNDGSKWDKYAESEEGRIKVASAKAELDAKLAKAIERNKKEGMSLGNAIFAGIEEMQGDNSQEFIRIATDLFELASDAFEKYPSESVTLAKVAEQLTKEAQSSIGNFFRGIGNMGRGIGNAVGDVASGVKQNITINTQLSAMDRAVQQIMAEVTRLNEAKNGLVQFLSNNPGRTPNQVQNSQQVLAALQQLMPGDARQVGQKWQNIRQQIQQNFQGQSQQQQAQPAAPAAQQAQQPAPAASPVTNAEQAMQAMSNLDPTTALEVARRLEQAANAAGIGGQMSGARVGDYLSGDQTALAKSMKTVKLGGYNRARQKVQNIGGA
tara:strand:- start:66372 stop:67601 length:1230 start_codon:yes stop_codon:yes gene_type:complete